MTGEVGRILSLTLVATILLTGALGSFSSWGMPVPAQTAFVILLTAATLWITEAVPLYVTSFIVLALSITWLKSDMSAYNIEVTSTDFLSTFFSDIILLFLGGFVLASAFHKYGFDEQAARWVIARTGGSPARFLVGIMLITAMLSMWLSNTATTAMMLALCLPITRRMPADDGYRKAVLLAIPFAANVGGLGTPIGSPPNAIAIRYMTVAGSAPSFGHWMLIGVPAVVIMLALAWGLLMMMHRGRAERIELPVQEGRTARPPGGVTVLIVAVVTIAAWLSGPLHGLSTGTVALLPVIVFFGARILDVADLRALSWDILILMGGGLCLGTGIERSGLAEWALQQLPTEGVSLAVFVALFAIVGALLSSVMSNTAAANLLMPIIAGMQGVALPPMLIGVACACSLSMALPISTPPNAMAFGSGELSVGDLVKPGIVITVVGVVLTSTLFLWWWRVVGLF